MQKKYIDLTILIVGLFLYSILNTTASYSYKYFQPLGKSVTFIFIVEMLIGILAYCVKIPLYYYYATQNIVLTLIIYISIYSLIVVLFSKFILHETVHLHSYLILIGMIALTCLNVYLDNKK